jgi:transposase-like protein
VTAAEGAGKRTLPELVADECAACAHGPGYCGTAVYPRAVTYLSIADVARELGVKEHTVTMWRHRYDDTPAPDAQIGRAVGWTSLTPWLGWLENRTGSVRPTDGK